MSKTDLEVMVSRSGDIDVVSLDGPADSSTFNTLKECLDSVCAKPGARVLVDCSMLSYLNSRAIGLLVKHHRSLSMQRGRLVFCEINPKVVRSLELLQLGKALSIYPVREDALAALKRE